MIGDRGLTTMEKNINIAQIGETAVVLELLKKGYDVININNSFQNYKSADLICMNHDTGKSVMIQVKTGTTHNILTGFTSELDGTVPELEKKVIGPWVFVFMNEQDYSMKFYVLTKEETIELIKTTNNWYINEWNRKLKSKPIVGVEVDWLEGNTYAASKPNAKKQHPECKSTLSGTSKDKWEKITELLL